MVSWISIFADVRALGRCTATTPREIWNEIYRDERYRQRRIFSSMFTGHVGSIYGTRVYKSEGVAKDITTPGDD